MTSGAIRYTTVPASSLISSAHLRIISFVAARPIPSRIASKRSIAAVTATGVDAPVRGERFLEDRAVGQTAFGVKLGAEP